MTVETNPLLLGILEQNAKWIVEGGELAQQIQESFKEEGLPAPLCFWSSVISAVTMARAGTEESGVEVPDGKKALMNAVEAVWESYDQFFREQAAGVAFPKGEA